MTWQDRAACRNADTDLFYPPVETVGNNEHSEYYEAARMICAGCPVQNECLDYANAEHIVEGMWGGLTKSQRAHARKTGYEPRNCPRCNRRVVNQVHRPVEPCYRCMVEIILIETGIEPDDFQAMSTTERKNVKRRIQAQLDKFIMAVA